MKSALEKREVPFVPTEAPKPLVVSLCQRVRMNGFQVAVHLTSDQVHGPDRDFLGLDLLSGKQQVCLFFWG